MEDEMKLFVKTLMNVASAGVMSSLLALAAAPAYAANDIDSFVTCVNGPTNLTVVDAVACVPSGCKTTLTLSEESAQPGCTLRDGTRLPRVIFSCAGTGTGLRFRPSFTLCTQGGIINHIEIGEEVNKSTRSDDAEVRTRCAAILPQVRAADWQARAQAFLADPAGYKAPAALKVGRG